MARRKPIKNVNNSSQGQKIKSLDLVDRISTLPNSILGSILSFLPTKEAVATAFLSKRWKFVWRNIYNLDFCFEDCVESCEFEETMKFVQFVYRVFLLQDGGLLNKFRLDWNLDFISSSHVNSWITSAVTRNVNKLYLYNSSPDYPRFDLPSSVFSCESLQSLNFDGIYVPAIEVGCLPRLESLKLVCFGFHSEKDFEKLISRCPVLNYLRLVMDMNNNYLINYGISEEFTYKISSTSLKRLELSFKCDRYMPNENFIHGVMLNAPSLEYLKLEGYISGISVQKNLSSLIEADFRIESSIDEFPPEAVCNSIVEAVGAFDRVKVLTLSADAMLALSCATNNMSTKFMRLKKLKATTYCCHRSSLQDLIQNSDNLEVLKVHQCSYFQDGSNRHDHSTWTAPVEVPKCLSNSLKKAEFECYYDYDGVREMIRYMLKHGSALEVIKVFCGRSDKRKLVIVQEICMFPRKSPVCEVHVM